MDEALVSVIIPVFNGERFIARTLDSALAQTYQPIEIVVADDGSIDRTPAIVEAAAARDARITLVRGPRSGVSAARNLAVSHARGSMIATLDADDLWHPDKIARQAAAMRASPAKVGVVYCWSVDIDENDVIIPPIRDKCTAQGHVVVDLAARNNFLENGSVPLIRRSFFDAVGGYDPSLVQGSEDWKLYLLLAEICDFAVVPAHLVGYRRSSINMSKNTTAMEQSIEIVERWILDRWPDLPADARRQMRYNANNYLAHQALTTNQFFNAVRYHMRSLTAQPSALLTTHSPRFAARLLARLLGIKRTDIPLRTKPMAFREFQPPEASAIGPAIGT